MKVPFEQLAHLVVVPVEVGGTRTRFVLDSGIGLTVVSAALAERTACAPTGSSYTGKRMSGQEVTLPLVNASVAFAGSERDGLDIGVLDTSGFPPELAGIEGFLSLSFFDDVPFTVDYARGLVETGHARSSGAVLPVRVERDAHSATAFLPLTLPGGRSIEVELDMGSDALILDESLAPAVGVALDDPDARVVEGEDETGHGYRRTFTQLRGPIAPTGAPELSQEDPEVMFQRIIHDGLVGHSFLQCFVVTWDLARSRVILERP